jgi:phosphoglycerate dehydrogenase-like enzyme
LPGSLLLGELIGTGAGVIIHRISPQRWWRSTTYGVQTQPIESRSTTWDIIAMETPARSATSRIITMALLAHSKDRRKRLRGLRE